ncbi:hypothetical protein UFOVP254_25 [uncultured Caudovirales phage]|uniref:DNA transfer protein n=1 Tax=uncultured Caudovirales phage TaxID=2100421 RepID=A0A6J5LFM1_9CAUD|nr:hypothetical protein UFOVP76_28 [uncultured Caudovirales phage]CAB4132981.1 hypothetical protein UFOVP254_25 [uncultured Caudovirales phage]
MTFWVAGAAIGGSILSSNAASSAADTQAAAADRASQLQKEMFDKQVSLQEPFRQGGMAAQNRLMTLLGLGGTPAGGGSGGMGAVGGAVLDALNGGTFNGLNVNTASPDYGKYARDFQMSDFQQDPGYAFRLSEGMKALDRSAAARGGLLSGATLKGAERYGQDMASQEYQNAFNRYQINRANQLNPLQSLMGAGQTGANTLTSAAGTLGSQLGSNAIGAGNARASGYVGSANAWNNAIGQGVNQYNWTNAMNRIFPQGNAYDTANAATANMYNS